MLPFTGLDYAALAFYAFAWLVYSVGVERSRASSRTLSAIMDTYRFSWMEQATLRENRIVDTSIMGSLQNGSAFFASTSLFAVGGALALFKSTDEVLVLFAEMPFGVATTRLAWEMKVIGLAVIFVYAFFKFAWAYRVFNYAAILLGAVPILDKGEQPDEAMRVAARRAAAMSVVAGRHFNRGQRAFFFALAYLGWFLSPVVFLAATASVLVVIWQRQFSSDAHRALMADGGEHG